MTIEIPYKKYAMACKVLTDILRKLPEDEKQGYINRREWMPFIPFKDYFHRKNEHIATVSEETAQRIEMLLGNNANAIVRAWVLRNL